MTLSRLDRRALGRALSALANAGPEQLARLAPPPAAGSGAQRTGLTGAPGAGKSTLAGRLALHRAQGERRIGVLAIDPSSPLSGGAILGDRIRMDDLPDSERIYIRSLGSRGSADGLSDNLPELLDLMDAYGFDEVLVETVGVGQAEHAVRTQVDTLILVLQPEAGDMVQAMKAGIMELADIHVVNKADLPGAARTVADLERVAGLRRDAGGWRPPVLLAAASQPASIAGLAQAIDAHRDWLGHSQRGPAARLERARYRLRRLIERRAATLVAGLDGATLAEPLEAQLRLVLQQIAAFA